MCPPPADGFILPNGTRYVRGLPEWEVVDTKRRRRPNRSSLPPISSFSPPGRSSPLSPFRVPRLHAPQGFPPAEPFIPLSPRDRSITIRQLRPPSATTTNKLHNLDQTLPLSSREAAASTYALPDQRFFARTPVVSTSTNREQSVWPLLLQVRAATASPPKTPPRQTAAATTTPAAPPLTDETQELRRLLQLTQTAVREEEEARAAAAEETLRRQEEADKLQREAERREAERRESERREAERREAERREAERREAERREAERREAEEAERRREAEEIEAAKKEEARRQAERSTVAEQEQQLCQREEAASQAAAETAKAATEGRMGGDSGNSNDIDRESSMLAARAAWREYLADEFQRIAADPLQKEFRMLVRSEIVKSVNQIASSTRQIAATHQKIYAALSQFLHDPAKLRYAVAVILESICTSAEEQVLRNPASCWAYARCAARLAESIPRFRETAEGAFAHQCMYVIPVYVTKTKEMSMAEFQAARDQRKGEADLAYFQRQAAVLRAYLAYHCCLGSRETLWVWWARICNLRPRKVTPELVDVALAVSGCAARQIFGKQYQKLMAVLESHLLPALQMLQAKDSSGNLTAAVTRIQMKVESYKKRNYTFETPEGLEMPADASASNIAI